MVCTASGCFAKPSLPVGTTPLTCTDWHDPIELTGLGAGSVNGGWLSDDGTELWFTRLSAGGHAIYTAKWQRHDVQRGAAGHRSIASRR